MPPPSISPSICAWTLAIAWSIVAEGIVASTMKSDPLDDVVIEFTMACTDGSLPIIPMPDSNCPLKSRASACACPHDVQATHASRSTLPFKSAPKAKPVNGSLSLPLKPPVNDRNVSIDATSRGAKATTMSLGISRLEKRLLASLLPFLSINDAMIEPSAITSVFASGAYAACVAPATLMV